MDGHFVPRYGLYPEIVKRIIDITDLKLDLHLMVADPEFALDQFAPYLPYIEYVNFHYEAAPANVLRIADRILELGSNPGVAINMSTNPHAIVNLFESNILQSVCIMGIHPGVLKQNARPLIASSQATFFDRLEPSDGRPEFIQVDGGVQLNSTVHTLVMNGVNNLVCGTSTLYKGIDIANDPLEVQMSKMRINKELLDRYIAGEL
jgi:ribulose-phosphate 3-epimerase